MLEKKRERKILSFADYGGEIERRVLRVGGPFANKSEVLRRAVVIGLRELERGGQATAKGDR